MMRVKNEGDEGGKTMVINERGGNEGDKGW